MIVSVKWIVDLPLRIQSNKFIREGNDFVESQLTVTKFIVNGFKMELIQEESVIEVQNNVATYEKLSIEAEIEYKEDNDLIVISPNEKNYNKAYSKKYREATVAAQSFLDGVSKETASIYYQIIDEYSFIVPHKEFIGGAIIQRRGRKKDSRGLDNNSLDKAVEFANKDKKPLDNAWYLLRNAERFKWDGLFDLSILNMAIMLEMLVKVRLTRHLKSNGEFRNDKDIKYLNYYNEFKNENGIKDKETPNMPFVNKYFDFGLFILNEDPKFDSDEEKHTKIMNTICYIFKIRNKIAHGISLYDVEFLKQNGLNKDNLGNVLDSWIVDCDEVYYYFCKLENKPKK